MTGSAIRIAAPFVLLLCVVSAGVSAQERSALVAARVEAARARLAQALAAPPPNNGVPGRILMRLQGSYEFAPKAPDLPIAPIANPRAVSPTAVGPELRIEGKLDPSTGQLTVEQYRLAATVAKPDPDEMDQPEHQARAAGTAMVAAINDSMRPGAMSVTSRSLNAASPDATTTRNSISEIVGAYQEAVTACASTPAPACKPQQIDAIVKQWNNLRSDVAARFDDKGTVFKALYGTIDNYDPWRYNRIFNDAPAVVALGEPSQTRTQAFCSGVLIGRDLVLTAAHCFAGNPVEGIPARMPDQFEVWFDFAQKPSELGGGIGPIQPRRLVAEPVAPPSAVWPTLLKGEYNERLFDYAIVRIRPEDGKPLIPNGATPRCLRTEPLHRGDPVYVLGYPRGERARVHDNARVYLPYKVQEGPMFARLRLDVEADLVGEDDRADEMRNFDDSYVPSQDGGLDVRFLNDVRDNGQPRMGIIADLFRGDSGGPVFDHDRDQCVVGILNRGMPDTGKRLGASWKQHERVLPIRAILDDLKAHDETRSLLTNGELVLR